jgi:TRAP-type C4-dicarboxylate transport system permease small subunit
MENEKKFGHVQNPQSFSPFWLFWNNLEMGIGIVSIAVVTLLAFSNVIARYILGHSIQWAEEVCKFFVIWMTFGGAAYAFRLGVNIGVSFFIDRLPEKVAFWFGIVIKIVIIVFFAVLMANGFERVAEQIAKAQVSTAARIPMAIPYSAIPVGSALVIIRLSQQMSCDLLRWFKKGDEEA